MTRLDPTLFMKPVRLVFMSEGWDEAEAYTAQVDDAAQRGSAAVQKLMQTEPHVECTGDSMRLKVQGSFSTPGALFVVDRGKDIQLPLYTLMVDGCQCMEMYRYLVQKKRKEKR